MSDLRLGFPDHERKVQANVPDGTPCAGGTCHAGVCTTGGTVADLAFVPPAAFCGESVYLHALASIPASGTELVEDDYVLVGSACDLGELGGCTQAKGLSGHTHVAATIGRFDYRLTVFDSGGGVASTVESLDVPFYLHPRPPLPRLAPLYEGHPWLFGPTWSFAAETSLHALRLIGSGLFDECPRLQIILGHLGEGLPYYLWRIDNRNSWMKAPHKYAARERVADYFRANFHITTSGHFSTPALVDAIAEIGADRVMFSVDYPFEDFSEAARWFDAAEIGEADRIRIGRTNAMRLFRLGS